MWLGNRLDRMDAARPEGVQLPHQLASRSEEVDEIEWQQLLAFEAGEEEWWLIVPTAQEWAEIEALGQD